MKSYFFKSGEFFMKFFLSRSRFWLLFIFGFLITGSVVFASSDSGSPRDPVEDIGITWDASSGFREQFWEIKRKWDVVDLSISALYRRQKEVIAKKNVDKLVAAHKKVSDLWKKQTINEVTQAVEQARKGVEFFEYESNPVSDYQAIIDSCNQLLGELDGLERIDIKKDISTASEGKNTRAAATFLNEKQRQLKEFVRENKTFIKKILAEIQKEKDTFEQIFSKGDPSKKDLIPLQAMYQEYKGLVDHYQDLAGKMEQKGTKLEGNYSVQELTQALKDYNQDFKQSEANLSIIFTQKLAAEIGAADKLLKVEDGNYDYRGIFEFLHGKDSAESESGNSKAASDSTDAKKPKAKSGFLAEIAAAKAFTQKKTENGVSYLPDTLEKLVAWFDNLTSNEKQSFLNIKFFDIAQSDLQGDQDGYQLARVFFDNFVKEKGLVSQDRSGADSSFDKGLDVLARFQGLKLPSQGYSALPDYLRPWFSNKRTKQLSAEIVFPTGDFKNYFTAYERAFTQDQQDSKDAFKKELQAVLSYFWFCSPRAEDKTMYDLSLVIKAAQAKAEALSDILLKRAASEMRSAQAKEVGALAPRTQAEMQATFLERIYRNNPELVSKISQRIRQARQKAGLSRETTEGDFPAAPSSQPGGQQSRSQAPRDTAVQRTGLASQAAGSDDPDLYAGSRIDFRDEADISAEEKAKISRRKTLAQQLEEERNYAGGKFGRAARGQRALIESMYKRFAHERVANQCFELEEFVQGLSNNLVSADLESADTRRMFCEGALQAVRFIEVVIQGINGMAGELTRVFNAEEGQKFKAIMDQEIQDKLRSILPSITSVFENCSDVVLVKLKDIPVNRATRKRIGHEKYEAELLWLSGMIEYVLSKETVFVVESQKQNIEALKTKVEEPIKALLNGNRATRRNLLDQQGFLGEFTIKELGLSECFAGIEPEVKAQAAAVAEPTPQEDTSLILVCPYINCMKPVGVGNGQCPNPYYALQDAPSNLKVSGAQQLEIGRTGQITPEQTQYLIDQGKIVPAVFEGGKFVRKEISALTSAQKKVFDKKTSVLSPANPKYRTIINRLKSLTVPRNDDGTQNFDFMTVAEIQRLCTHQGGKRLSNFTDMPGSSLLNDIDVYDFFKKALSAKWDALAYPLHPLSIDEFKGVADYFTELRTQLVSLPGKPTEREVRMWGKQVTKTLAGIKRLCFDVDEDKQPRDQDFSLHDLGLKPLFDKYFINSEEISTEDTTEARTSLLDAYCSQRSLNDNKKADQKADLKAYDARKDTYDYIAYMVFKDTGARILKEYNLDADQISDMFAPWYYISQSGDVYKGTYWGPNLKKKLSPAQQNKIIILLEENKTASLDEIAQKIAALSGDNELDITFDSTVTFERPNETSSYYRICAPFSEAGKKASADEVLSEISERAVVASQYDLSEEAARELDAVTSDVVESIYDEESDSWAPKYRKNMADAPTLRPDESLADFQVRKKAYDDFWNERLVEKEVDAEDTAVALEKMINDRITRFVTALYDLEQPKTTPKDSRIFSFMQSFRDGENMASQLGKMKGWREKVINAYTQRLDREISGLEGERTIAIGKARNTLSSEIEVRVKSRKLVEAIGNDTKTWLAQVAKALGNRAQPVAEGDAFPIVWEDEFQELKDSILRDYAVLPEKLEQKLANIQDEMLTEEDQDDYYEKASEFLRQLKDEAFFEGYLQSDLVREQEQGVLVFQWLKLEEDKPFPQDSAQTKPYDFFRVTYNQNNQVTKIERSTYFADENKGNSFEAFKPVLARECTFMDADNQKQDYRKTLKAFINGALGDSSVALMGLPQDLNFDLWEGDILSELQQKVDRGIERVLAGKPVARNDLMGYLDRLPSLDDKVDCIERCLRDEISEVVTPNVSVDKDRVFIKLENEDKLYVLGHELEEIKYVAYYEKEAGRQSWTASKLIFPIGDEDWGVTLNRHSGTQGDAVDGKTAFEFLYDAFKAVALEERSIVVPEINFRSKPVVPPAD